MTKIPERIHSTASLIDQAHESRKENPRPHLGASQIGHSCDRWLWLSFRWSVIPSFPGRVLRIFRRGHHEENWIVQDLRSIGVDIHSTGGSQARVDFGCHFSGSIDGIIESGLPEAPNTKHVAEFKTHSKKSFDDLVKKGVEKSKPVHYAQMQTYMAGLNVDRAFYLAVCKDNDQIYTERVKYDKETAQKYINRGTRIPLEDRLPAPISTDSTWFECRFCDAYDFCHGSKTTKEVNCRTCAHSTALKNSTWRCELFEADGIPYEHQLKGCQSHVLHPDLVPWQTKETEDGKEVFYIIDGVEVLNGPNGFSSSEILANPKACTDKNVADIRQKFNGKVIE